MIVLRRMDPEARGTPETGAGDPLPEEGPTDPPPLERRSDRQGRHLQPLQDRGEHDKARPSPPQQGEMGLGPSLKEDPPQNEPIGTVDPEDPIGQVPYEGKVSQRGGPNSGMGVEDLHYSISLSAPGAWFSGDSTPVGRGCLPRGTVVQWPKTIDTASNPS